MNIKKITPSHIMLKSLKLKIKRKMSKVARKGKGDLQKNKNGSNLS